MKADYSCDFSGYGAGITPVTVSMTSQVFSPWPVNQPDQVSVLNDTITLPPQVSSQLSDVDGIEVKSQVTAKHASQATISLEIQARASSSGTLTGLPQLPVLGQVTFPAKGTAGSLGFPAHDVTFTPMAGTTAKPAITCTTATAARDVTVTVGNASGNFYHCVPKVGRTVLGATAGLVSLSFAQSGTKKTGDSLTVTLASADVASLISGLALSVTPAGITLDKAAFSADLAVTGAQSGTLHMAKTITDLTATTFSASAKLKLTKAGTVKVAIPSRFAVDFSASGTAVVQVACTLVTKPAPTALTLTVTKGPGSSGTQSTGASSEASDSSAAADDSATATATPSGGAATGGGPGPGGNVPMAIGGAALFLIGGGLVLSRWRAGASCAARRRTVVPGGASDRPDGSSGDCAGGPAS